MQSMRERLLNISLSQSESCSRQVGNFLRTKYLSKLRRHFTNIDRMALQSLPMFVRQEITEFLFCAAEMSVSEESFANII